MNTVSHIRLCQLRCGIFSVKEIVNAHLFILAVSHIGDGKY